jgi:hypothetical protein
MAKIGTIKLLEHDFNIYPRSEKFNSIGVIYVMAKLTKTSSYSLIYVGETGNASQRPFNHHRKDCFDKHGADHVFIKSESNHQNRLDIETAIRQHYDPPCNQQ